MPLTLAEVRAIAADTAIEQGSELEIIGVTPAEGDFAYAEVLVRMRGCRVEPCRMVIGVNRSMTTTEVRATVNDVLRRHHEEHGRSS